MESVVSITTKRSRWGIVAILCMLAVGCSETSQWSPDAFYTDANLIALLRAVEREDCREIDRLVADGADLNSKGKDDMTPLFWAIWKRSKLAFVRLLERGANPNLQVVGGEWDGMSVTSVAAEIKDSSWLEAALQHGGNPNLVSPSGFLCDGTTPIYDAIRGRSMSNLDLLIRAGADINHRDRVGSTPALAAARIFWFEGVHRLLEAGADFKITKGSNEFDLACAVVQTLPPLNEPDARWREKVATLLEQKGVNLDAAREKVRKVGW